MVANRYLETNDREPHPIGHHRETMPPGKGTVIKEGEWLWKSKAGPESTEEVPAEIFPLGLTWRNAGWLAEECKALLEVPHVWAFVPEGLSQDYRVERLVFAMPSNVLMLRPTRVRPEGETSRRWEWAWHGPHTPETEHGVKDMAERGWIHIWEDVVEAQHSNSQPELTVRSQTATTLWKILQKEEAVGGSDVMGAQP